LFNISGEGGFFLYLIKHNLEYSRLGCSIVKPLSQFKLYSMKDLQRQAAEKAFVEFTTQLYGKNSKGFISESEHGKIFSFESYLRETGQSAEVIADWCDMAGKDNFLASVSGKVSRSLWSSNIKTAFLLLLLAIALAIVLYLVVATVLLIFGVSLWNGKGFLYSVVIGTVLIPVYLITKSKKKQRKAKEAGAVSERPLFVIKYFDNDDLTFAKAKSRLFVEK
jgi:hypothetical protein